ncbi:MAG: HAD family hydrolase [Chlorobi bacterium]|nr:HAD family hydrolase [Chlorobiota bacterium]
MNIDLSNIKAIIWDWNGTLLDDVDMCVSCMNKLLLKRNLPFLSRERYIEIFTFPVKKYYEIIGFDFSKEDFEIPAMEFINNYQSGLKSIGLHQDALNVLDFFKTKGLSQYILSAMEHDSLIKSLTENNINEYFIDINGIDNHYAHSKLEIGRVMLSKLDHKREEYLLIGDTLHDMDVAEGLGIQHLLIANGHQSKNRLLGKTRFVVDSLADFDSLFV